jgi:type I restriction enzyme R subunit
MSFNELNSVEHYIIHKLTGTNLNDNQASEPPAQFADRWIFIPA